MISVTPPDTSDSKPTVRLSGPEQPADLAFHTQMTFDPPPVQEDTEHLTHELISPQIAELESTNVPQTTVIEPTIHPTESSAATPDILDIVSTSQQSNPEVSQTHGILRSHDIRYTHSFSCCVRFSFQNLNGSSSFLQSFDVRPIMAAPVFTKVDT